MKVIDCALMHIYNVFSNCQCYNADMSNVEDHTIKLLQEMRAEISGRFDGLENKLDRLSLRVDVLEAEMKAGFLAMKDHMRGFAGDTYSYDRRLMNLETDLSHFKADVTENSPPPDET